MLQKKMKKKCENKENKVYRRFSAVVKMTAIFVGLSLIIGMVNVNSNVFAEAISKTPVQKVAVNSQATDAENQSEATSSEEEEQENSDRQEIAEEQDAKDKAVSEKRLLPKSIKARGYGRRTVWFDGTLGLGNDSLVKGASNTYKTMNNSGQTKSPTDAGGDGKYKLNGWYNIKTGDYYKPGETVDVNEDSVFYADWVQSNYNIGLSNSNSLVANQPDTSSFVRTDVFDYNEIFNAKHGAKINGNINFQNSYYANSHSETWKDDGSNNLLFTNWYNWSVTNENNRSLGFPRDSQKNRNAYSSDNDGYTITDGIVNNQNDYFVKELFTPSSAPGREYLGEGNNLFQYDSNNATKDRGFGTGYYYYDSDHNGADYNKEKKRFYVYNEKQFIQNEDRSGNGWKPNNDRTTGFMPLTPAQNGDVMEKSGQTNYWFGMKTQVDFFLPDDVGEKGGNITPQEKPMRFYFSGDDDVWVFVDDVKVLDLGGIHKRVSGDINFSTGEISYKKAGSTHLNGTATKIDKTTLKKIKSGNHKLTIYYLERGSSKSNCSIYFNLAPRYQLNLEKTDGDNGQLLSNAEFSVYADKRCSIPARLWDSEEDCKNEKPTKNVFKTNSSGKLSCYGLMANRTYYIKETEAPALYPSVADKVIELKVDAAGNVSIGNSSELNGLVSLGANHGNQQIQLHVQNKKPPKTSISVQKKWYKNDGSEMTENLPDSVQVELYRSTKKSSGGSSGGSAVSKVPVNFTSQYFENPWNSWGASGGYNMDIGDLKEGDSTYNTVVTAGGTIDFTITVRGRDNKAGVYAVTANGKTVTPVSYSNQCGQNCYVAGNWGYYPYTNVRYKIPIKEATNIKVTLIGYLEYVGSEPLTSATMNIVNITTHEPESPGGSGGTQPSDPTGEIPEDAELVKEPAGIENPAKLDGGNNWHKTWNNLPTKTPDGLYQYYYYVKEKPVEGFSTSYSGNGVLNGTVNISNVKVKEIILQKKWLNVNGTEMKEADRPNIDIDAVLIQKNETTGTVKRIPVRLTKANQWKKHWWCDGKDLAEKKEYKYKYTVEEISHITGYTTMYENNTGIEQGEIAIKNKLEPYKLPNTGGMGTYIFMIIGSFMVSLSVLLAVRRMKSEKYAVGRK